MGITTLVLLLSVFFTPIISVAIPPGGGGGPNTLLLATPQCQVAGPTSQPPPQTTAGSNGCVNSQSPGLRCQGMTNSGTSTSCSSLTFNSGLTCLTGSAAAIPAGSKISCCGIAPGCNVTLTGTVNGTAGSYNNDGNTFPNAFDGNFATYFDAPTATGAWVGLDLGAPVAATSIAIAPRSGWESRFLNSYVHVSNYADFTNYYTVLAFQVVPVANQWNFFNLALQGNYRYIRIWNVTYGNVADFQVYGCPQTCNNQLKGTVIGSAGSYNNDGYTIANAQDGNTATYYDAANQYGSWVGLDLGAAYQISSVSYVARSSFNARLIGAQIQATNDINWGSGNVYTIGTISIANANPTLTTLPLVGQLGNAAFQYVRIFNATQGNIAEFQFYGCATINCDNWVQSTTIAAGTSGSTCLAYFNQLTSTTATGNCYASTPVLIGTFSAGNVQVNYIQGAIEFSHGGNNAVVQGWSGVSYWSIRDGSGTEHGVAPGKWQSAGYVYNTPYLAQADNTGQWNTITLSASTTLYLVLIDSDYTDNWCSTYDPNAVPEWSFTQLP